MRGVLAERASLADAPLVAGVILTIALASVGAALVPARRALAISPSLAMRDPGWRMAQEFSRSCSRNPDQMGPPQRTWNVSEAHFDSWVSVSIFTCTMLMNLTYHMPA